MPQRVVRSPELFSQICELLASGYSLVKICKQPDFPSRETVHNWIESDPIARDKYARAKQQQADYFAEEIIDIADSEPDPNRARVQVDARKWYAAKSAPRKYGDNQAGVTINNNILVIAEDKRAHLMERRKALTQASTGQVQG